MNSFNLINNFNNNHVVSTHNKQNSIKFNEQFLIPGINVFDIIVPQLYVFLRHVELSSKYPIFKIMKKLFYYLIYFT